MPEVFNRYEKKCIINECQLNQITALVKNWLGDNENIDLNHRYKISNLYYDTAGYDLIRRSMERPTYKEKLRIRCYGEPFDDCDVYVEIKKKVKGLVNKRRCGMKLFAAYEFLSSGVPPAKNMLTNPQVINEISYILSNYKLSPSVFLSYDRHAIGGKDEECDFRITFDNNIRYRTDNLKLTDTNDGKLILDPSLYIMEVKVKKSFPVWLSALLSELEIYPCRFSKYGTAYKDFMHNRYDKINENIMEGILQ